MPSPPRVPPSPSARRPPPVPGRDSPDLGFPSPAAAGSRRPMRRRPPPFPISPCDVATSPTPSPPTAATPPPRLPASSPAWIRPPLGPPAPNPATLGPQPRDLAAIQMFYTELEWNHQPTYCVVGNKCKCSFRWFFTHNESKVMEWMCAGTSADCNNNSINVEINDTAIGLDQHWGST